MEKQELINVTKDHILSLHMEMIEQLKEEGDPKNKSYIIKLLDQVSKITGSYTTIIKTGEITADDVLDGMKSIMDEDLPEELRDENIQ